VTEYSSVGWENNLGVRGVAVKKRIVPARKAMSRRAFLRLGGAGIAGAAFLNVAGCGGGGKGETRRLTYAYEQPEETSQGIAANIFQQKLEELSDGSISIEQYPAGQLGGEPPLLQKVVQQELDFVNSSTANASLLAPQSGVLSLHYLFDSNEHAVRAVADQQVNEIYKKMTRESVSGGQALTLYASPLRNFYSKSTEVRNLDDLKGQKVRVQATRTEDVTYATYGAQTVHMQFSEVYTSLQTGVVDMAENALMYYGTAGHYDVAPVMSLTEHSGNTQVIWVTDQTWASLSEEERGWVQAAADEVRRTAGEKGYEWEKAHRPDYRAQGVEFIEDVDKGSFKEIAMPLQDKLAQDLGEAAVQIVERVREIP
jgi:tripartite ATP-independent transporter DctP family solute receptor